ncbi:hypothetical protein VOLCADRAFT_98072 [Volvox carteri f. nagariensis]|uniref:Uncharacterized protein n=1 Tax=Volvox carteri f. nagariensis TaxID=3068 RepID=D8UED3_VOLCA|nr:uncharacterized protein VOLCADRAFT_98072 [Volvox carteri f. nagariensis]EFJ41985.1 hypothetical protein VOLCADRAFT_98072 [Volvox carteri f. nagariensis]|eukprot:XP_002957022.1 hypothetical protein VOLCADRAFT_98072 [Volvox carteri f. nagariensis]
MSRVDAAFVLLDSLSSGADDVADAEVKLKKLVRAMDVDEVSAFVDKAYKLAIDVQISTPVIRRALEDLAEMNLTTVSSLNQAVKNLEEMVASLIAEKKSRDEQVLLGQVAYILDEVATEFVFRGDKWPRSCSIGTLLNKAVNNELTQGQMQRWHQLQSYLSRQGWTISDLVGKSGELCSLRYPRAHSSQQQQEETTLDMIKAWVDKYHGGDTDMHQLVQLVSKFTVPNKPLCKSPTSCNIIENMLYES